VNFVEFWESITWEGKNGEQQEQKKHFAYLTDIAVDQESIITIVKGGRAR
jgi:hypothetical protein